MKNLQSTGTADFATLGGPTIKAANTRHLVPFILELANKHLTDDRKEDHIYIHILVRHANDFNRLMYSSGMFLTPDELAAFTRATEGIGKCLQALRARAKAAKQLFWHIVPKTHYMQLFPDEAKLSSHRIVLCYIEESYIGNVASIWSSSKNGPYGETIQHTALLKYLVRLVRELDL